MSFDAPNEAQLDALREVANVGCGNAANALSRMVGGKRVSIDVPQASLVGAEELTALAGGAKASVVVALLAMEGDLGGQLLLVLPKADAQRLATALAGEAPGDPLGELHQSALVEVSNILASACLNAIGTLAGFRLWPSPPKLWVDTAGPVLERCLGATHAKEGLLLVLQTSFVAQGLPDVSGRLFVLPTPESLQRLLARLGV